MLPTKFTGLLKQKTELTWKVSQFLVELSNPPEIKFESGQFINIKVDESSYRSYSLCSSPFSKTSIEFIAEVAHEGKGALYLHSLATGDPVTFIGPSGKLSLRNPLPNSLFFLVTGTGIAPIVSMLYQLENENYPGKVRLLFGIRTEEDIFFLELLNHFKSTFKDFDFTLYISQSSGRLLPNLNVVHARITQNLPLITNTASQYYVCGHPEMVTETVTRLIKANVPSENIITEQFIRSQKPLSLSFTGPGKS